MDPLLHTTAIIKTFHRPRCLDRLIRSIRKYFPMLHIIVGDDGFEPTPRSDVEYLRLPVDIGTSAGRNAILAKVETPYYLLLDDDLEFRPESDVRRLARLVADGTLDLAAGDYLRAKRKLFFLKTKPQPFHGLFEFKSNELRLVEGSLGEEPGYSLCDITHNFYVARKDAVQAIGGWDEDLKTNEHIEFFVRARRAGMRVGFCRDVVAWHWNARPRGYAEYRDRNHHHVAAMKLGLERIVGFDGRIYADITRRAA
jgi:GT2 family glycosyltransferase